MTLSPQGTLRERRKGIMGLLTLIIIVVVVLVLVGGIGTRGRWGGR
jgi:flagellin-like protein